jgi:hypothetical protein
MKLSYIFAAAAALCLASCSDNEPADGNKFPDDNVIRVTTNINDVVKARSTSDYTGDDFALYISPADAENIYTYKNVWFGLSAGQWLPIDGSELHWQSKTTNYTYSAYAPAAGTNGTALTDNRLSYDLSNNNFDLIWTSGKGLASDLAASGALNLTFDHQFCRFALEIVVGNSFYLSSSENPIDAVSFTNATGKGQFNVLTGEITNAEEVEIVASAGSHTAGTLTEDGVYTTAGDYIAPGEQSITVNLTVNGDDYSYTHPFYNFEAGKSYTLKIKVGESSVNATGITISQWNENEATDISTH